MKKKRKPSVDSPKAKAEQLKKEWEALLARHTRPLERGALAFGIAAMRIEPKPVAPAAPVKKSDPNSMMGVAGKTEPKVYTGTSMIGIATMHKSNMIPIFSNEEAVAVATMRRG